MTDRLTANIILFSRWRKKHISNDNFLILSSAAVGALAGVAATVLKKAVHFLADYLQNGFDWEYKYYLFFFFPLIGILLTLLYLKLFIRKKPFRSGIPPLIRSISNEKSKLDFHNIYSQIITSALTVGMGGSAGLEAPAASGGATIGANTGLLFGLRYRERTLLLACGGAAGISAAFGSPVAGMVFALEVLLPSFSVPVFIPLLMSSAVAFVLSKILGNEPLFIMNVSNWDPKTFWLFVIFGIIAGFYSIFFSSVNERVPIYLKRFKNKYTKAVIGGLSLGVLVALFPAIYGEGYLAIQELLDGNYKSLLTNSLFHDYQNDSIAVILFGIFSLIGKTYGCVITMSSGGNGGMFGPSVGIGGLLGFVFAFSLNQTGWTDLNVAHFIIVGMAASVSGAMHAPLTGVFLAAEITGGYKLIVPLMMVSAIAYLINKGIRKYSIYTKPLADQGEWTEPGNRDSVIISKLKVTDLIENDFVVFSPSDTAKSREREIVHANRLEFPVVDENKKLLGIVHADDLFEHLLDGDTEIQNLPVSHIMEAVVEKIKPDTEISEVLQQMDKNHIRIIPVTGDQDEYLGFVTKTGIFASYRRSLMNRQDLL